VKEATSSTLFRSCYEEAMKVMVRMEITPVMTAADIA